MSLQVTTTATTEPVALADVKARLRLTATTDDTVITAAITQAREFCERVSGRSLAAKSYALFLDRFPFPYEPIRLPMPPLASAAAVTAIKYLDGTLTQQTWTSSEYWVAWQQAPALIVPVPGTVYPQTGRVPGAVEVDFTTAGECPPDWQRAVVNVAIFIYENPGESIPEALVQIPKIYVF